MEAGHSQRRLHGARVFCGEKWLLPWHDVAEYDVVHVSQFVVLHLFCWCRDRSALLGSVQVHPARKLKAVSRGADKSGLTIWVEYESVVPNKRIVDT